MELVKSCRHVARRTPTSNTQYTNPNSNSLLILLYFSKAIGLLTVELILGMLHKYFTISSCASLFVQIQGQIDTSEAQLYLLMKGDSVASQALE